jgi:hypothetical protein
MSRPTSITQTGAGTSRWVPVSRYLANTSIAVVVSGTVDYTVQATYDDVFDSTVTATAFDHGSLAAQTANASGAYTSPITAVRIKVNSGSGSATMTVIQAA